MANKHIKLTSHPDSFSPKPRAIEWGASTPMERGPVVGTLTDRSRRNVIGTHSGSYAVYRALAVAAKALDPDHRPDLHNTAPTEAIGPHSQWFDPKKIVSIDPFGATVHSAFADYFKDGWDIRPTIAVTQAHLNMPEVVDAMQAVEIRFRQKG
jgi:hypothetical protein